MSLVGLSANPVGAHLDRAKRIGRARGRAYFDQALRETRDFRAAFDIAAKKVKTWEGEKGEKASNPQIFIGARMSSKLDQWLAEQGEKTASAAGLAAP